MCRRSDEFSKHGWTRTNTDYKKQSGRQVADRNGLVARSPRNKEQATGEIHLRYATTRLAPVPPLRQAHPNQDIRRNEPSRPSAATRSNTSRCKQKDTSSRKSRRDKSRRAFSEV